MLCRLSHRHMLVAIVLMVVASLILVQLPLLNYLGFEFSVAIALIVPWVIGFATIGYLRRELPIVSEIPTRDFLTVLWRATHYAAILLLIPFVVASLNIVFVKNCSYGEGILYFLLIPVVTAVWSVALAAFCFVMFRRARLLFAVIVVGVLLYTVYLGYALPQIHTYNFVYGYFPGFSYDEVLTITTTLVLFRVITLIAALFLFFLAVLFVQRTRREQSLLHKFVQVAWIVRPSVLNAAIVLFGLVLAASWVFRAQLGFESPPDRIQQVLSSTIETEHFRIYYAPGSFTGDEIERVAAEHEFRFHQISTTLQTKFPCRIDSYVYPNDEVKREFIGAGRTNIAKPWLCEIHLNRDSWSDLVKHELVHVVAGEFGMPIIRAHYNIGLVEGLAMAVDDDFGNHTLHEYAASLLTFDLVRDPAAFMKPVGFATRFSAVSYVMMGSFCQFLIDRYGMVRFKQLYGGKSVRNVYDRSYEELVGEWRNFLTRIEVPEAWRKHVLFYFDRPSIFAKECARTVANLNKDGYDALVGNDPLVAMKEFSRGLETSWNTDSYAGLIRAAYNAARYDTVVRLIDAQTADTIKRSALVNLYLLYGDARWHSGDYALATRAYEEVYTLDLSVRFNEAAALRIAVMSDSILRDALVGLLIGSPTDSVMLSVLDSLRRTMKNPLLAYLHGRTFIRQKRYREGTEMLHSVRLPLAFPVLDAIRELMIGQAYFMLKEYQQARTHFWQSLNFNPAKSFARYVDDWLERCEWYEWNAEQYLKR